MTRLSGEARRRQLLVEAIRLFGHLGYDATTLDSVAEAAGVRKQTLLYYYPSKEELFEACVTEFSAHVSQTLEEVLTGDAEGWDRVETVIRGLFAMARQWSDIPQFIREAARRSPEVARRVAGDLEPLRKRALQFLEQGMDDGIFRRQDPGLLLFTLYTAVVGSLTESGVLRAVAGPARGATALRHREEELIEFVRRALMP